MVLKKIILGGVGILGFGVITQQLLKTGILGVNNNKKYESGGFLDEMNEREACKILGIQAGSDIKDVKKAHRELIVKNHPDSGGSPFISTKINEAKDYLIKSYKERGEI